MKQPKERRKINWQKVVKNIKTAISYFGGICLGAFIAVAIEVAIDRYVILGMILSAVLMITAKINVGDEGE